MTQVLIDTKVATIKTWRVRAAENSIMGETRDVRIAMQAEIDDLRAALANAERVESKPTFTMGHCKEKQKPGGCQLHNLQCGYPKCDRGPTIDLGRYAGTYGGYITKTTP